MTKSFNKIFVLGFLWGADVASAATLCQEFFAGSSTEERRDGTDDLTAYLGSLLELRLIGVDELRRLARGLDEEQWVNPISGAQASASSALLLHRQEIQEYFDATEINRERFFLWVKNRLGEKENEKEQRDKTREVTREVHQKMEFHPIPPGDFKMGRSTSAIPIALTHTIEMMSTKVTQRHWEKLMGENPSHFSGPDHPVENITWWSAIAFANKLSEKRGLKPAYDFTGIKFNGRAEDGTLDIASGELKINAPNANIYLAEGFRLPTEAEQEYVRKDLGRASGSYYFGSNITELHRHAWNLKNSEGSTHPVAELEALVINGKSFFDLYGNVWEWGHDWEMERFMLLPGSDPQGPPTGTRRIVRGGSWQYTAHACDSDFRNSWIPSDRSVHVGFRLVRTID